jgi:TolB-like protein
VAVLAELSRVVESPAFGGSARQMRLLRFLVGEVLAGRGSELHAPIVATRVFERPEGFDSTEDSIVRVEMSKLRRALARHYAVSPVPAVRIELPRGSYAPVFVAAPEGRSAPSDARRQQTSEPPAAGAEDLAPASFDGPVVAVLPFTALNAISTSSLPAQGPGSGPPAPGSTGTRARAFALGLTDRLHDLFARVRCMAVVSHASTVEEAAARGARYVLEGTVRLVPGALRVSAKLHDTKRWIQVWCNTYDRLHADERLFAVEDEIAHEIANQLVVLPMGALHAVEAQERAGHAPRNTYEVVLRFPRWIASFDPRLQAELRDACATIVPGDVDKGVLLALSSLIHLLSTWTAAGTAPDRRRGADQARRAVAAEPNLASSHQALAFALLDAGDGRGALAEAEIALGLGGPLMLTGLVIALAGDWERGVAIVRKHVESLKHYPGGIRHVFALDAYRRGDHAAALAEAEAIATPNLAWDPLDRAVALARLGRIPEARAAGRALTAILPDVARDPRAHVARTTADKALADDLVEALRLAGIG